MAAISSYYREKESSPTMRPISLLVPVITDGFGDFANALILHNTYKRNLPNTEIKFVILSKDSHIEKMQKVYQDILKDLNIQWVYLGESMTESDVIWDIERCRRRDPSSISVIVSSGVRYPDLLQRTQLDAFHELEGGSVAAAPVSFFSRSLQRSLGFSSSTLGLLLPDPTDISLEDILKSIDLYDSLCKGEDFLAFSQSNAISVIYLKEDRSFQAYFDFVQEAAQHTEKTLHILIPSGQDLSQKRQEIIEAAQKASPLIQVHVCPPLSSRLFDALVQKATFPPAITGNASLLHAIVGNTPFIYDSRDVLGKIMPAFFELLKKHGTELDPKTLEYFKTIAQASQMYHCMSREDVKESQQKLKELGAFFIEHEAIIRADCVKIQHILKKHRDATATLIQRYHELNG